MILAGNCAKLIIHHARQNARNAAARNFGRKNSASSFSAQPQFLPFSYGAFQAEPHQPHCCLNEEFEDDFEDKTDDED